MVRPVDLISPAYCEEQRMLHAAPRGYGGRGDKWAGVVVQLAAEYGATSILDYGCGQGTLVRAIHAMRIPTLRLDEYDPAMPGKDALPSFADLVVCTDVLEHIEKDKLPAVLAHLRTLARKALWVVVSTKESNKVLSDGRNAHVIIKPAAWWKHRFEKAGFQLRRPPTIVRDIPDREYAVVLLP
jgi:2-polyprenyl-3-methyl-5-hydroxy-6-metoxy-1,4-benzoquinol methylase